MATKKELEIENIIDPKEDKVTITISPPTEADEDKGMFISVNDYNAYIKYGVEVEVPRFMLAVLENRRLAIADKKKNEARTQEK